jgi:hypothetical protein
MGHADLVDLVLTHWAVIIGPLLVAAQRLW